MKAVLVLAVAAEQWNDPTAAAVSRELCGPIAVQTVLRHFGKEVSLPELTANIFGESRGRFSSMASLDAALHHYGAYALALDIGKDNRIEWREPVIVHLRPSSPDGGGHFAVILPTQDADGQASYETVSFSPGTSVPVPWRKLSAKRSRIVLLTSASPINRQQSLAEMNRRNHRNRWALVLCISVLTTCLFSRFFHTRSSQ
jgi:ABC-type bacteriocin/lantibiotic exporter with double-glycine peptidase domain